ncbi:MAG: isoleucine--tRNA ligase [Candidatus Moranbacteria bacterium]|jgi:isoleucyl-tRNA synthetase|nr:isoleucine--tRNA ligase [Candidatus Moranbacteria bacterium]
MKKVESNKKFPEMEKEVLKFWGDNKIFKKSLENRKNDKEYTFYDGPPFATGTPHYGHIVASILKDVVPRYWTMRGYYVERKWGWDCHGLPIENIVEKEMGSKKKKDIEEMGVEKFNNLCRSKVLTYVDEWERVIGRLGRWADMKNAYRTMDKDYMESVWWVFRELWDRGLIYEDYRSMHICPRCETTLSQSEVTEGYKDIKDLSVIAKFELDPTNYKQYENTKEEGKTYILAWTTTPWTLPGNVALAVGENIEYVKLKIKPCLPANRNEELKIEEFFVLAKERVGEIFKSDEYEIIEEFEGKKLIGKRYKPLFDNYFKDEKLENRDNGWQIYAGDFVTTDEGTGVVHIAPAFGEDDMRLGKEKSLPFIQHVAMDGNFKEEMSDLAGLNVKPIENHQATDIEIIKYLAKKGTLFSKEKYEHSYPHCWRCDTPLINYATSSWFVAVTKIKDTALKSAKNINWSPANMKEGRFGNWLDGARDWSISRQRFWASVMPIWVCEKCGEKKVIGSVAELEKLSGEKIDDLHKHTVDKITFVCEKCQKKMKRVPDVLDTWFDSGSMPYAQKHYPFENQERFEKNFPADFIAEGIDQTRAWFYYLHIIGNGIKDKEAFRNVIVNGIVLAEDGKKMAKKLKNYPDPMEMLEKYGADSMRYYLMSSPVVAAQNLSFKEGDLSEVTRGMMRMLWNSYSFFVLYAEIDKFEADKNFNPKNLSGLLDKWIISELQMLIRDFNSHMENYELHKASRLLPKFVDNLSNWYIRRSRKRFWKSENDGDKNEAYQTLYYVLTELSKVMAPFTPFIAEEIYKNLTEEESVHLADFPMADENLIDENFTGIQMERVRAIVNLGLQFRSQAGIKVRQPLSSLYVENHKIQEEFIEIIKEEINVKDVTNSKKDGDWIEGKIGEIKIGLNKKITPELKLEGQARELIRHIQEMRKEAGYEVDNRIKIWYAEKNPVFLKFGDLIARETLADQVLLKSSAEDTDLEKEIKIGEDVFAVSIKR